MEVVLLGILTEACEDFFFYVVRECEANSIHASATTDAVYNNFISGTMTYNFVNASNETVINTADFTICSGMSDLTFLDDGVIRWQTGIYDSDTPTVTVVQSTGAYGSDINILVNNSNLQCYINGNLTDVSSYVTNQCAINTFYSASYGYNGSSYWFSPTNGLGGRTTIGNLSDIHLTSNSTVASAFSNAVYVPSPADGNLSYNDFLVEVVEWASENYPEETITIDDLPSWEELASEETETETGGNCCDCNCNTIYVNADGSLILQNDISGDFDLSVNNEADLSLNINAAAGAFGAGAIVIDPDAEISITAGAGAFGAGAFGAGAIVSPDVSISGDLSVGDISGEVSLQVSEVSFEISGGNVTIDQSGATNNNTYNTTNNYYYDPSEPVGPEQESFSIDYNEILSEDELESILTQESYEVSEIESITETVIIDIEDLVVEGDTEYKELMGFVPDAMAVSMDLLSSLDVSAPLTSAAIISCIWRIIKGR